MSATNGWNERLENLHISTDDYDFYGASGEESSRPGRETIDNEGQIIYDHYFFPLSADYHTSTMDPDPNNTGPTNDFWTDYPIIIDVNGDIFYDGENTGINIRGPIGAPRYIHFDELTEEEKQSLKGADGRNGIDGLDGAPGQDGQNGLDAYQVWKRDHPESTSIEDFYAYIASFVDYFIKQGSGNGSLILNYKGLRNTASGEGATAGGNYTQANGNNSFVIGDHTISNYANQFVFGKYNENKNNNILEIGNGTNAQRKNILEVDINGKITSSNEIVDGSNNILSHKLDKVEGKQLSTNDFTDTYKSFIDNYEIDSDISSSSSNPVENRAVYEAINDIRINNQKPTIITTDTQNKSYPFLFLEETESSTYDLTTKIKTIKYNTDFTWRPDNRILNNSISNEYDDSTQDLLLFGKNLISSSDDQIILGKNNLNDNNYLFQIGNGTSSSSRSNAFIVTKDGKIISAGDVQNGNGDLLSHKQEQLSFDSVPTEDSTAVITSGDLWDFFVANNWDEDLGFYPPDLTTALEDIDTIQSQITTIQEQITALQAAVVHEITDDTTGQVYIFGIDNGEFYIKPKPQEEEDDDEDENEEESEEVL